MWIKLIESFQIGFSFTAMQSFLFLRPILKMFKSIKLSYRHVWFAPGVDGLCHRVDEVAGNPEIAHLHTSIPRDLSHTKSCSILRI